MKILVREFGGIVSVSSIPGRYGTESVEIGLAITEQNKNKKSEHDISRHGQPTLVYEIKGSVRNSLIVIRIDRHLKTRWHCSECEK